MIVEDLIERSSLREDVNGYQTQRAFHVSDVSGDPVSRLYLARQAPGVPRYLDPHPAIPGLRAVDVTVEPAHADSANRQFRVVVTYRIPTAEELAASQQGWSVELSATAQSEQTSRDRNGTRMTGDDTDCQEIIALRENIPTYFTDFESWTYTADVQRPQLVVRATRRDQLYTVRDLIPYVGRLNASAWNGFAEESWLCVGVFGESPSLTIEFQWRETTWHFYAETRLADGTFCGGRTFRMYHALDFAPLGIVF